MSYSFAAIPHKAAGHNKKYMHFCSEDVEQKKIYVLGFPYYYSKLCDKGYERVTTQPGTHINNTYSSETHLLTIFSDRGFLSALLNYVER